MVAFFRPLRPGNFLELGANDGLRDSNTLLLEEHGWTGILVEADPQLAALAGRTRPRSRVVNCLVVGKRGQGPGRFFRVKGGPESLNGLSTALPDAKFWGQVQRNGGSVEELEIQTRTVDEILEEFSPCAPLDLVSIDIEGGELEALAGFDLALYRPRLLLVEDNTYGRDRRVASHLQQAGYQRVHRTGVNDWYVGPTDAARFRCRRLALRLRLLKWAVRRQISLGRHRL